MSNSPEDSISKADLAEHVKNYHLGCEREKRAFLNSLHIEWPEPAVRTAVMLVRVEVPVAPRSGQGMSGDGDTCLHEDTLDYVDFHRAIKNAVEVLPQAKGLVFVTSPGAVRGEYVTDFQGWKS